MKPKNEKKKPVHSFSDNLRFIMGNMWKWNKRAAVYMFLRPPFTVAASFLLIIMSVQIVGAVTEMRSVNEVLFIIAIISLALIVAQIIDKALERTGFKYSFSQDIRYSAMILNRAFVSDYENMESPSGLMRISKACSHVYNGDRGIVRMLSDTFSGTVTNAIGVIFYGLILFRLNPLILIVTSATSVTLFFIEKMSVNWNYRNKDNWMIHDRKLFYLQSNSGDFSRAKDMRLYNMNGWFRRIFADTVADRMVWYKKREKVHFGCELLVAAFGLLREGFAYGILITLIFARDLSVADFVLYFGVIGGFSAWLLGFVDNLHIINVTHVGFSEVREFLDYPDVSNYGKGEVLPEESFDIEFKDVSFRYEGSDNDTISNLSFKIRKGEKLAIVGLNGAGKTTLVKLMSGLYNPKSGRILVDGRPVNAYNRDKYYTLFSAVFQDITILPMSVAANVSCVSSAETDRAKVQRVLELAGLWDKIKSLPKGIDTMLVKSVYEEAVDFSGGERQKLALARALYKDGKALILDEPTAALDPIAESNIYMEYSRMSQGKTSVFISHRLASTRFCDRIFFLEDGKIAESGSHEELMSQKGKYYEMFEIQSRYYKEGALDNDFA